MSLREKVRRLIVLHITSSGYTVDELADAAIALVLEEAAKVVDTIQPLDASRWDLDAAADAIRALKDKP